MNYKEALKYIETAGLLGSKPGLKRIRELCFLLGNPQEKVKYVHVAGTNGKGSVCAILCETLKAAGYKTGLYTSPHLRFFEERIKINGEAIPENRLVEIIEKIKNCADGMDDKPTEFEIATAAAFVYFCEENCDIAILETGLGGRLDATNVIGSPVLSVITGIALDHTAILGDTLEKIAREKGGIIKDGAPLVLAECRPDAANVLEDIARDKNAPVIKVNYKRKSNVSVSLKGTRFNFEPYGEIALSLIGLYQADNASTAITAAEALESGGVKIPKEAIRHALKNVRWQARFEILSENPLVIYDGAHNPQGAKALINTLGELNIGKAVFVSGVMKDKDYLLFAKALSPVAKKVFAVAPRSPRALAPEKLAGVFKSLGVNTAAYKTVSEGVVAAANFAKKENLPLIICGSLYMYGEVKHF